MKKINLSKKFYSNKYMWFVSVKVEKFHKALIYL